MQIVPIFNMLNLGTGLPIVQNFVVPAGFTQQLLVVSGTAMSTADNVIMEVEVLVGPTVVGTLKGYSHGAFHHWALTTSLISLALPANATYTLTIREKDATPTTTDVNDFFSACLVLGP